MKKIIPVILCLMLCCVMLIPVSAKTEPKITMQPYSAHYPEYSVASYTVKATGTNLSCTWFMEYQGVTYNISQIGGSYTQQPWEGYAGESYGPFQDNSNTFTYFFNGIGAELAGAKIWCVIEDGHYDVKSQPAYITVQGNALPPIIHEFPSEIIAERGEYVELRCVASSPGDEQINWIWYETSTGQLPNIMAIEDASSYSDSYICDTSAIGTRYYVCGVTSTEGGLNYTNVCAVTVKEAETNPMPEPPVIKTRELPDAVVGEKYNFRIDYTGENVIIDLAYNPGRPNQFDETGLTLNWDGTLSGTPTKAGTFGFKICASGLGGEAYEAYTLTVRKAQKPVSSTTTSSEVESKPSWNSDAPSKDTSSEEESMPEWLHSTPDSEETSSDPNAELTPNEPQTVKVGFPWWGYLIGGGVACGGGVGLAVLLLLRKR